MVLKLLSNMDDIGEKMASIAQKLIPDWVSFVIQFSSFIILLLVVFFFAYKPVKKMLKKRADYIQQEIDQATESHALAVKETQEAKRILSESKSEASQIIENATKKGEEKYEAMIKEMVNVALTASKEILKREVDKDDNARLAEDFINRLN